MVKRRERFVVVVVVHDRKYPCPADRGRTGPDLPVAFQFSLLALRSFSLLFGGRIAYVRSC